MIALNSDEYYLNRIKELEDALSKCSVANGNHRSYIKELEVKIASMNSSIFRYEEKLKKERKSLHIALSEIEFKNNLLSKMNEKIELLEERIKSNDID